MLLGCFCERIKPRTAHQPPRARRPEKKQAIIALPQPASARACGPMYFLIVMRLVVEGFVIYGLTRLLLLLGSEAGCIMRMIVNGLVSAGWELWMSIRSSCATLCDAVMEIWRHLTRENIHFLVALCIIIYAIPEIAQALRASARRAVVLELT